MTDADHSPVLDGVPPPVDPPVMDLVPPPLLRQTTLQPADFGQVVHINGQSFVDMGGVVEDNMNWDHIMRISGWLEDIVMNNTMSGDETEREDVDSSGSETEDDEEEEDNELYMALLGPNE